MARGSAPETELGELHAKIARVMSKVLSNYEKAQDAFATLIQDGITPDMILELPDISPAMLAVITKFLADNKITAAPEDNTATSELGQKLIDRQTRRAARDGTNVIPMPGIGT